MFLKKLYWCLLFSVLSAGFLQAQTASVNNGLWNSPATWNTGIPPDASNSTGIAITHEVTIPPGSTFSIDETSIGNGGNVIIEAGATITVAAGAGDDVTLSGTGLLNVNGTLVCNDVATIIGTTAGNTNFLGGSVYQLLYATQQGVIPTATWDPNSTFQVSGYTGSPSITSPAWSQNFGNVIFDFPGNAVIFNFAGLLRNIAGDFTVNTTNPTSVAMNFFPTPVTINIGGDVIVTGNSLLSFNNAALGTVINIGGDFNYMTSNTGNSLLNGSGSSTMNIDGDFIMDPATTGSLTLATSATGLGIYNFKGDFIFNAGTIQEIGGGSLAKFNFTGTTPQSFSRNMTGTSMPPAQKIDFTVETGVELNILGNSFLSGDGELVIRGTLGVGSTDINGAVQNNTTESAGFGNIRLPLANRTFENGSTIVYNGMGAQYMSNAHPSDGGLQTTISNAGGVTVVGTNVVVGGDLVVTSGDVGMEGTAPQLTINGDLTLMDTGGDLNIGTNAGLVLNGDVIPNSRSITTTILSDITINGTGSFGLFPFPPGNIFLRNLTLNRSAGSVSFDNNLIINNSATLTTGDLIFNQDLTLIGTFTATSGALSASPGSSVYISGSGNLGTLIFNAGGSTLATFSMNRGGSATLGSALTITNSLDLLNGNLTNGSGITVEDGVLVTRNSNSQLLANGLSVAPGDTYDLIYTGISANSGLELPPPASANVLNNLTIDGGPFTLTQDISINGNFHLVSGSLNGSIYNIAMHGATWTTDGGSFVPGTSRIFFTSATTIAGSSDPQFSSIQINNGATVILPNGNTNISGHIDRLGNGVLDVSNKTITLNGSNLQSLSMEGASLTNIIVDKSGGDVQLTTPLSLTGSLNIQTTTIFESNGFLTLISTSDGPVGNASIAPLLSGGAVEGDVIVQRFMSGEGRIYRYLSSPVEDATIADWQDNFPITGSFADPSQGPGIGSTSPSLYYYDEVLPGGVQNGWIPYPTAGLASENLIEVGRGYSVYIREATLPTLWDVVGRINQGTVSLPVTYENNEDPVADGWNLVGNPFPATVDWDEPTGWIKSNIGSGIAVKDNETGNFRVWDGNVGNLTDGLIATGQAFWVRTIDLDPELQVQEEAKSVSTGGFFRTTNEEIDYLEVIVAKGAHEDRTYFRQRDGASDGLDPHDIPKFSNDYYSLAIVSGSTAMAVSAVENISCEFDIALQLSFTKTARGEFVKSPLGVYQLEIKTNGKFQGTKITIEDKYSNTSTPLNGQPYAFTIDSSPLSYQPDRFKLRVLEEKPDLSLPLTGDEILCSENMASFKINNAQTHVDYSFLVNGVPSSETITGTGAELTVDLPSASFNNGENLVQVKAEKFCAYSLTNTLSVKKESVYEVASTSGSPVCREGSAELQASGAPSDAYYNWYDDESSQFPLSRQKASTFYSPIISRSQTYFVAIENSLGCEGARIPVKANVISYEEVSLSSPESNTLHSSHATDNIWYLDGEMLLTDQQELKVEESGLYRVEVNIEGCITFAEQHFIVTGAEDTFGKPFTVFPNPATDILHITFENEIAPDQIAMINSAGVKVNVKALPNQGRESWELSLSHLPSGLYHIVLHYGKRRYVQRVIKL